MAQTFSVSVLAGKSLTTDAASDWYAVNDAENVGIDVVWNSTVNAGAVDWQTTNDPDNADATVTMETITYPARVSGVPRTFKFMRAKISTNLGVSTLDEVRLIKVINN